MDTGVAYGGHSASYGQSNDPMIGSKIGGVNVFGGGLALVRHAAASSSAASASAATRRARTTTSPGACAMRLAWITGSKPATAAVGGVSGDTQRPDNIVFDIDGRGRQQGRIRTSGCAEYL